MERNRLAGLAPHSRRNDSGFLYVEVLVALVIFASALLAITPMFTLCSRYNAVSADLAVGATLAQEMAEELRAADFESLTAGSGQETVRMELLTYERAWLIEVDKPHPEMKQITVTVAPTRLQNFGPQKIASVRYYRAN